MHIQLVDSLSSEAGNSLMLLTGEYGTGKTTVIANVLRMIMSDLKHHKCALSNQAKSQPYQVICAAFQFVCVSDHFICSNQTV